MNPLAFNFDSPQQMRNKPKHALAILPMGLMFISFAPLWLFSAWLGVVLGIPDNVPVKEQPHGFLYACIVLVAMVLFMLGGYLLGWVLNALAMRIFFKWPKEQVSRVFLYSEIPPSWLKDNNSGTIDSESAAPSNSTWANTRQKGKKHFIIHRGILAWGVPMYVIMACLPAINGKAKPTVFYFFWEACLWGAAGAAFGLLVWHFSEKQFIKKNGKKAP
jgi:hypothetical protein